ncbi:MAG: hypothetical protein ACLS3M_02130 [Collinsella sp.]
MLMFYSLDERGYQGLSVGSIALPGIIREERWRIPRIFAPAGNLPEPRIRGREWSSRAFTGSKAAPFRLRRLPTGTMSLALYYHWYIKMSKASGLYR